MALEDIMGAILFVFGMVFMIVAFLAVINVTDVIEGFTVVGFFIFGFILCVTGFIMARSAVGGVMNRFRR